MVLKLNVGCGNKLYPAKDNWINVDIIESKAMVESVSTIDNNLVVDPNGLPYYHQSDLRDLKWVESDCADEIHGYHIIEHFFLDEVQGVLKEWFRVLKPGGMLALEQPDVTKCAANFLSGLLRNDMEFAYHLGFLGFFGDGTSKAPYMGHKWGWFPSTLADELRQAGYVDIVETPAKTHRGPMRDFRLEAYKPKELKDNV